MLLIPPAYAQHSGPTRAGRKAIKRGKERRKSTLDLAKINDLNTKDPVGPHAEGEGVVRAAILLDRLKFSPGQISSSYNDNLAKAIAAFQSVSGLPPIGIVDEATWTALNDDQAGGHVERVQSPTGQGHQQGGPSQGQAAQPKPQGGSGQPNAAQNGNPANKSKQQPPQPPSNPGENQASPPPALVTYTVAMEDATGLFTRIPVATGQGAGERQMLREAKLRRLNYQNPLDLLAEKFHSSPRLLVQLNPRKRFNKAGEQIQVPNVLTSAPPPAQSVVVDASTHSVTALDGSGRVLAFYPATVGSEHDPLPVGKWKIVEVKWYPKFKYNPKLFWDAEDKRARATLPPGPRNPVGVVWVGLSKQHYGIHGTPAPGAIGKTQSHGCIRLTNWDAAELANMVRPGMEVLLEEGIPSEIKSQPAS